MVHHAIVETFFMKFILKNATFMTKFLLTLFFLGILGNFGILYYIGIKATRDGDFPKTFPVVLLNSKLKDQLFKIHLLLLVLCAILEVFLTWCQQVNN